MKIFLLFVVVAMAASARQVVYSNASTNTIVFESRAENDTVLSRVAVPARMTLQILDTNAYSYHLRDLVTEQTSSLVVADAKQHLCLYVPPEGVLTMQGWQYIEDPNAVLPWSLVWSPFTAALLMFIPAAVIVVALAMARKGMDAGGSVS